MSILFNAAWHIIFLKSPSWGFVRIPLKLTLECFFNVNLCVMMKKRHRINCYFLIEFKSLMNQKFIKYMLYQILTICDRDDYFSLDSEA
jgi:hypothetical protein